MVDFVIPPLESEAPLPSEAGASEQAFYAAGSYSQDPVTDYQAANTDLQQNGRSDFVDKANTQWQQEQTDGHRQAVMDILSDSTVSDESKKAAVAVYQSGGLISTDLKDKYIEKTASTETGYTKDDLDAQDAVVSHLQNRVAELKDNTKKAQVQEGLDSIGSYLQAAGGVASTMLESIPAGYAAAFSLLKDRDIEKASAVLEGTKKVMAEYGYHPEGKDVQEAQEKIGKVFETLGVPAEWVGEKTLELSNSPALATAANIILDPLNFIPLGWAGSKLRRGIKAGSAADVTRVANPKIAENLGGEAVADNSGAIAKAMGTDQGSVIQDWVLPKLMPAQDAKDNIDLGAKIKQMDQDVEYSFNLMRYDPNVVNATERLDDTARIAQVLSEARSPYYQQANSLVGPPTNGVFEGKAIFGRNGTSGWMRQIDATQALAKLQDSIKQLPEELKGDIYLTRNGEKYVPPVRTEFKNVGISDEYKVPEFSGEAPNGAGVANLNFVDQGDTLRVVWANNGSMDTAGATGPKKGVVTGLYKDAAVEAANKGKRLVSDNSVTIPASKIWERLEGQGFSIRKNKNVSIETSDVGGSNRYVSTDGKPVFEVTKVPSNLLKAPDGDWRVEWNWKKQYEPMDNLVFGADSINTSVFGLDVSRLARSKVGNWLFPTGRFPDWYTFGGARAIERSAKQSNDILKHVRENIAQTEYPKELSQLINNAEETGVDYFSKGDISAKFPNISAKGVNDLFDTHTYWRRVTHYHYNLLNDQTRKSLDKREMQGLYDGSGNYIGAATNKISESELNDIHSVWDMESGTSTKLDLADVKKKGQEVVRLADKIEAPGEVYTYALLGKKHKLDLLPAQVLPRVPGWSPRKVDEHFFVDIRPKSLTVNGKLVSDEASLRGYSRSIAAARTQYEADKLVAEMQHKYPDSTVTARPERSDSYGQILSEYESNAELFQHSRKRGERLPSGNGLARIEDRLVSLIHTTQKLANVNAFSAWEETTQKAFTKGFSKFLVAGQFPTSLRDIVPLKNMTKLEKREFDTAVRIYENYARQKTWEYATDFYWKNGLHYVADILEKFRIPASAIRSYAKKEIPFIKLPKQLATVSWINLNPLRQWVLQPQQLYELNALHPAGAAKNMALVTAIRLHLVGEAPVASGVAGDSLKAIAKGMGGIADKEFDELVQGFKDSGLPESVDLNVLVHGVFAEADAGLIQGAGQKAIDGALAIPKGISRFSRSIGFDAAELTNKLAIWLQTKSAWESKHPGQDWKTLEAKEQIAGETWRISGNMNKAGSLPYQQGALSALFQFAAIGHKQLMNLLVDQSTNMTKFERTRLAAVRASLLGVKYGIPAGAAIYYYVDQSTDPVLKQNAEVVKRGLVDYVVNKQIAPMIDPDVSSDLAVSKMMSPYSEHGLPYVDFYFETMKLFDGKTSSNPRYPVVGIASSFGKTVDYMEGWFTTRDVNDKTFPRMVEEAASFASGYNNWVQGQLMLSTQDKITKMGSSYGQQYSAAEAWGKMLVGAASQKEEDLFKVMELKGDRTDRIKETAAQMYEQISHQQKVNGDAEDKEQFFNRMNSFVSLLEGDRDWTRQDTMQLVQEIVKLDQRSYSEMNTSVFVDMLNQNHQDVNKETMKIMDILSRSEDPKTKEFVKAWEEGNL